MFGLGPLEILVIGAAFVIFVGPDKIPEVTKQLAKFFVQAKRMSSDVKGVVDDAIRDAEREIEVKEIKHLISDLEEKTDKMVNTVTKDDHTSLEGYEEDPDGIDEEYSTLTDPSHEDYDPACDPNTSDYCSDYARDMREQQKQRQMREIEESPSDETGESHEEIQENEDGVPNTSVDLNSAIERPDPFQEEESSDQTKKTT